jgi:hypothetical protein
MAEVVIRPNQTCVPTDLQGQAGWFGNWNAQMQIVGASLGFSPAELDRIKDDNTYLQFMAEAALSVEACRGAMTDFRRGILVRRNGSTTPGYPSAFAGLVLPATGSPVTAGLWDRLNHDIERVRAYPTYTTETGSLLGTNPTQPTAPDVGTLKPGVQVFAAAYGMDASIVVSGREGADQWQVLVARVGTTDWQVLQVGTGKSVDVHFTPGPDENGPVQLQFRIQLRLNNQNYGQVSDIVLATLNP